MYQAFAIGAAVLAGISIYRALGAFGDEDWVAVGIQLTVALMLVLMSRLAIRDEVREHRVRTGEYLWDELRSRLREYLSETRSLEDLLLWESELSGLTQSVPVEIRVLMDHITAIGNEVLEGFREEAEVREFARQLVGVEGVQTAKGAARRG